MVHFVFVRFWCLFVRSLFNLQGADLTARLSTSSVLYFTTAFAFCQALFLVLFNKASCFLAVTLATALIEYHLLIPLSIPFLTFYFFFYFTFILLSFPARLTPKNNSIRIAPAMRLPIGCTFSKENCKRPSLPAKSSPPKKATSPANKTTQCDSFLPETQEAKRFTANRRSPRSAMSPNIHSAEISASSRWKAPVRPNPATI